MARHLSRADEDAIVALIDGWPGAHRLTWEGVLDAVEKRLGFRPTRQTLCRHAAVKIAFQARRRGMAAEAPGGVRGGPDAQRLARLEAELERVRGENALLLESLTRVIYNVAKFGISRSRALEPLPLIDRGRSD